MQRLAEVPGLGADSAQQVIAEVGATAATLPVAQTPRLLDGHLPWQRGKRRRELQSEGTIFALVYRRLVPRLGHAQATGAIAHRLFRLIWKILHQGIRYEERGPAVSKETKQARARKMIRGWPRSLGYQVQLVSLTPTA